MTLLLDHSLFLQVYNLTRALYLQDDQPIFGPPLSSVLHFRGKFLPFQELEELMESYRLQLWFKFASLREKKV